AWSDRTRAMSTTADQAPALESLRREQSLLRLRLGQLRRRIQGPLAPEQGLDAGALVTIGAARIVGIAWWFRPGTTARLVLLTLAGVGIVAFLAARAIRRWRSARLDDVSLALTLDRFRPGTGQRLVDVLQLPNLLDDASTAASPTLVRLAVRRAI